MYKTILVPIDLTHSKKGGQMIDIARRIGTSDARIILVNVIEDIPTIVAAQLPEGTLEKAHAHAEEELKAIARAAGIKPDYEVRSGGAHNTILNMAQEQGVDLIIIGSHKPGLQDFFLGSTAARVVRHATCPVLVER